MKAFAIISLLLLHQVTAESNTQLVTQASNQFANVLYQKLAQNPDNVLVCPISLHVALTLLLQGAGGSTATELASVLKLNAASNSNVKEGYKAVLEGIQDDVLKIANKLYPAVGFQLNPDYLSVATDYFLSGVQNLNYSDPNGAAKTINTFVAEKTNNKINNLISPDVITDLTRLIIVNAVHFQGTWKNTFTSSYEGYFRVTPDKRVKTNFMTQTSNFGYKDDPVLQAKVLKMDYDKEGYSMIFILPNTEGTLQAVEAKLADTSLDALLNNLEDTRVEVTIPKFKVEQTLELKEILVKMGLSEVFDNRANLQGLASGDKLYVSDVIQKTFINVHENGTEAAAATVFIETLSANPDLIVFYATKPFHYILIHNTPSLVLFEGRFVKPLVQGTPVKAAENQRPSENPVTPQQGEQGNIVFTETPSGGGNQFQNNKQVVKPGQQNGNNRISVTPTQQQLSGYPENPQPVPQLQPQNNQQWQGNQNLNLQHFQTQDPNQHNQVANSQKVGHPGNPQPVPQLQPQNNQQWQANQNLNLQHFQTQDPNQHNQVANSPQVGHLGYPQPQPTQPGYVPQPQPQNNQYWQENQNFNGYAGQPRYPQPVVQTQSPTQNSNQYTNMGQYYPDQSRRPSDGHHIAYTQQIPAIFGI